VRCRGQSNFEATSLLPRQADGPSYPRYPLKGCCPVGRSRRRRQCRRHVIRGAGGSTGRAGRRSVSSSVGAAFAAAVSPAMASVFGGATGPYPFARWTVSVVEGVAASGEQTRHRSGVSGVSDRPGNIFPNHARRPFGSNFPASLVLTAYSGDVHRPECPEQSAAFPYWFDLT
jgi:hypothetical protein